GAGGLQGIEKKSRGLVVDLLTEKQVRDLHERHLDGVGVLENGEDESGDGATGAVGTDADAFILKAFMEVAEAGAPHGGRSALSAVDLDVVAAIRKTCHLGILPRVGDLLKSSRCGGFEF